MSNTMANKYSGTGSGLSGSGSGSKQATQSIAGNQVGIQSQNVNFSPSSTNTQTGLNNMTNANSVTGSGASSLHQSIKGSQTVLESQNINGSAGSTNSQAAYKHYSK